MPSVITHQTNTQETLAPDNADDLADKIMSMTHDELLEFIFRAKLILGLQFD